MAFGTIISFYLYSSWFKWEKTTFSQPTIARQPDFMRKLAYSNTFDTDTETKYILIWNEAYGSKTYFWGMGSERFRNECPESRCYVTSDRSMLGLDSDFDAIMFHQRSLMLGDIPNPSTRRKDQRYIHWMFESPAHLHYDSTPIIRLGNFFNWSMSYRLDSKFPARHGSFSQMKEIPVEGVLEEYMKQYGINNTHLANKTIVKGIAAAFMSNCHSVSHREKVIKLLKMYLNVDVYGTGSCSDPGMTCPRSDDAKCLTMLNTSYKFYFSFENSLCADYITEKFWKVLKINVIPVVLNGVDMTQHAPPHSYIDIKDFKTLKDAAKYMIKVSEDDKLFASYFWWRDFYIAKSRNLWSEAWCGLCSSLHNKSEPVSVIQDLHKWWATDAKCFSM